MKKIFAVVGIMILFVGSLCQPNVFYGQGNSAAYGKGNAAWGEGNQFSGDRNSANGDWNKFVGSENKVSGDFNTI